MLTAFRCAFSAASRSSLSFCTLASSSSLSLISSSCFCLIASFLACFTAAFRSCSSFLNFKSLGSLAYARSTNCLIRVLSSFFSLVRFARFCFSIHLRSSRSEACSRSSSSRYENSLHELKPYQKFGTEFCSDHILLRTNTGPNNSKKSDFFAVSLEGILLSNLGSIESYARLLVLFPRVSQALVMQEKK
ncbi:hypothetical protein AGLY_003884 [Aphis glycines]|uniref:Uncharacterized protein n=1 Tax=Aphis glycines TaxID=307491 RepID=A0A6G0TZI8_APHGL|nr:hypothetical protein AGLY_003884 [Aphis glycines]